MDDEGFKFEGVVENTPENVEFILLRDPNEQLKLISPKQLRKWKRRNIILILIGCVASFTIGIDLGAILWR